MIEIRRPKEDIAPRRPESLLNSKVNPEIMANAFHAILARLCSGNSQSDQEEQSKVKSRSDKGKPGLHCAKSKTRVLSSVVDPQSSKMTDRTGSIPEIVVHYPPENLKPPIAKVYPSKARLE